MKEKEYKMVHMYVTIIIGSLDCHHSSSLSAKNHKTDPQDCGPPTSATPVRKTKFHCPSSDARPHMIWPCHSQLFPRQLSSTPPVPLGSRSSSTQEHALQSLPGMDCPNLWASDLPPAHCCLNFGALSLNVMTCHSKWSPDPHLLGSNTVLRYVWLFLHHSVWWYFT